MKGFIGKIMVSGFVLVAGIMLLASNVLAVGPYEPYLNYAGNFSYVGATNTLTMSNITMASVTYLDLSGESYSASPIDPILGATINIGALYNTAGNSAHFDNGSGGGVTFEIKDGTYTYLSATLTSMDFTLIGGGSVPTSLSNIPLTTFNLTNVSLGSGFTSQYISELTSIGTPNMQFSSTFSTNFPGDGMAPFFDFNGPGTATGTMQGIVSAPEPISSVLFLVGGVALAVRFNLNRKNKI